MTRTITCRAAVIAAAITLAAAAQPPAALQSLRNSAAQGDAQAAYQLGYALDTGGAGNAAEACRWYTQAGDAGVPQAAFNLAAMYDEGRCGARDPGKSATWFGRAAAAGDSRAEAELGRMYAVGDGLPVNLDQAQLWYQAAASAGVSGAARQAAALADRQNRSTGPLRAVTLEWPAADIAVMTGAPVPFVWTVPPQPTAVKFFLEVMSLQAGAPRPVFSGYLSRSATMVDLPAPAMPYRWRVFTVMASAGDYRASGWSTFSLTAKATP